MSSKAFSIWLLAARPRTLWAAIAPIMIGSAMARGDSGFHLLSAVVALFAALMIQIGTNFANDYFDHMKGADSPGRTGPLRVTQARLVTLSQMKLATGIAFAMAFSAGIYLVMRGGWPIVAIGLCSILFGILYTGGPYPLGYNGLGELFVLIFFGPVAVGGTYYVQTLDINMTVLLAGLSPGLLSVAILSVNNLRDIDGDALVNKRTLAVRMGRSFARLEFCLALTIAILIPTLMVLTLGVSPRVLITLAVIIPAVPLVRIILKGGEGEMLNGVLTSTGRLLLVFSLLFTVGWLW